MNMSAVTQEAVDKLVERCPETLLACWVLKSVQSLHGEARYVAADAALEQIERAVMAIVHDIGSAPIGIDIPIVRTLYKALPDLSAVEDAATLYERAKTLVACAHSPPLRCRLNDAAVLTGSGYCGPVYADQILIPFCLNSHKVISNADVMTSSDDGVGILGRLLQLITDPAADDAEACIMRAKKILSGLSVDDSFVNLPFGFTRFGILQQRLRVLSAQVGKSCTQELCRQLIPIDHPTVAECLRVVGEQDLKSTAAAE
jgi:hypothetical protein